MEQRLEVRLGGLLRRRGWTLAVAESCTGGLLADRITDVPGSSEYFVGGVVAYANSVKERILGVSPQTLDQWGAVSRQAVLEMARGAQRILGADLVLSVSGIAGPGGGTPEKPVGMVWIGLVTPQGEQARVFYWKGDRRANKEQSVQAALQMAVDYLEEDLDDKMER